MAVISSLESTKVSVKLKNYTDGDGKVHTLSVNLGSLDDDRYDDQKAMNIINALESCFDKEIYERLKTEVSRLANDD